MSKMFLYPLEGPHNVYTAACLNPFYEDDMGNLYVYFMDSFKIKEYLGILGQFDIPRISSNGVTNASRFATLISYIKRKKAINKYNAYLCTRNALSKIVHDKKEKELGCPIKKVHDIRVEFDRVTVECDFINQAGKEVTSYIYIDKNINEYDQLIGCLEKLLPSGHGRYGKGVASEGAHPKARTGLIAAIITGTLFIACLAAFIIIGVMGLEDKLHWLIIVSGIIAFISIIPFAASIDQFRKYKRY